ncbi:Vp91 [Dikerogammarus haemobaphes nudivirus]|nr:Vp91 [Dikerogammarus haemobaphes nudivirus]
MFGYIIVVILLFLIVFAYYYYQRPKTFDLYTTYEEYLLRTSTPKLAFTKAQVGDAYENYYFDVDETTNEIILKQSIDPNPVNGDGTPYIRKDFGKIIREHSTGFYIEGIDGELTCPTGWVWNVTSKKCIPPPVCTSSDIDVFKGLTEYQFDQLVANKNNYNTSKSIKSEEAYHNRLYVSCIGNIPKVQTIETCTDNHIYNGRKSQSIFGGDGTTIINPCIPYDICTENREGTRHLSPPDDHILTPNEYYECHSSVSLLQTCPENLVFNLYYQVCEPVNLCSGKADGTTIPINDDTYIYCIGEREHEIQCPNGYVTIDNVISCRISVDKTYLTYFSNELARYPTSLLVYNFTTNTTTVFSTSSSTTTFELLEPLPPLETTTKINFPRNENFFKPISFLGTYVEYTSDDFTAAQEFPINLDTIPPYLFNKTVYASFHEKCFQEIVWDVINTRPLNALKYYKYNNRIYSDGVDLYNSLDYIPFITTNSLYKIKSTVTKKVVETAVGWVLLYSTNLPTPTYNINYPVDYILSSYRTPTTTLLLYINHVNKMVEVVEFLNLVMLDERFVTYSVTGVSSTYFNLPKPTVKKPEVQFSSILWYNGMDLTPQIIRPQFLLPVIFENYETLDNTFNIIYSKPFYLSLKLLKNPENYFKSYIVSTAFTGVSTSLSAISESLKTLYLEKV